MGSPKIHLSLVFLPHPPCPPQLVHCGQSNAKSPGKAIRVVAAVCGVAIDPPTDYTHNEDNKKPAFRSKFPHGKIPALGGKDGVLLFESAVIALADIYGRC
ncbi:hypothetical protein C8J57DRAFT_1484405 [Mycena rebaudengoi]|nr:hypothetical protein C8J57DRAFT_1484405 [Mycena rebaudengoi]